MEKLVYANEYYVICLLDKANLYELAEFVVRENYKHHTGGFSSESIKDEIRSVYQEELRYIDNSKVFVVRNNVRKIIGSIRVFKWDKKKVLPLQKIFGINPLMAIHPESDYSYWHIGRFAIDSFAGIPTITLFKQLMVYAVHPIVCDEKSYMIAEQGGHEDGGTDDEKDGSHHHDYLFLYSFLADIHLDVYLEAGDYGHNSGDGV